MGLNQLKLIQAFLWLHGTQISPEFVKQFSFFAENLYDVSG